MVTMKVQLLLPMVVMVFLLTIQVKCRTYDLKEDAPDTNIFDRYSNGQNGNNISVSDRLPVILIISKTPDVRMYDVDRIKWHDGKPLMTPTEIDCVFPNGLRVPFVPYLHRNDYDFDPTNNTDIISTTILRVPDDQNSQTLQNQTRKVNNNNTRNYYYSNKFANEANSSRSIIVINNEKHLRNETIDGGKDGNITELVATLLPESDAEILGRVLNSSETVVLNYSPDDKPSVYHLTADVPINVLHYLKNIISDRQETDLKPNNNSQTNTTETTNTGNGNWTFVWPDRDNLTSSKNKTETKRASIIVSGVNVSHIDTVNINVILETNAENTDGTINKTYNKRTGKSEIENTSAINSLLKILKTLIQGL